MSPPRIPFSTPFDELDSVTYGPPRFHWWQLRKRAQRLAHLETVARSQIQARLDSELLLGLTFEDAYLNAKYGAHSKHAVNGEWLTLVTFANGDGHRIALDVRLPPPSIPLETLL